MSQVISLCVLLFFFLTGRTETRLQLSSIHLAPQLLASILHAGLPSLCRHGAGTVSAACLNVSAGIFGGDSLIAALSIVSNNKGAGCDERIREAYIFTLRINMVMICVIAVLNYFIAPAVIRFFAATDAELIALGVTALRCHVAGLIFMPFGFSISVLLQAVGESRKSTFLALLPQAICYVPLVFLLPCLFGVIGLLLTPLLSYLITDLITIPFGRRYFAAHA